MAHRHRHPWEFGDIVATTAARGQAAVRRGRLVGDRTRYANRLHACLSETYGAAAAGLFPKLLTQRALWFFAAYPTLDDAVDGEAAVRAQVGDAAWMRLAQAGR